MATCLCHLLHSSNQLLQALTSADFELLHPHLQCECDRIVKAQHDRLLKALD
jgi:hypothetical protein